MVRRGRLRFIRIFGHDLPVMGLDLAEGTTDNLALDTCGLKPTARHLPTVDK